MRVAMRQIVARNGGWKRNEIKGVQRGDSGRCTCMRHGLVRVLNSRLDTKVGDPRMRDEAPAALRCNFASGLLNQLRVQCGGRPSRLPIPRSLCPGAQLPPGVSGSMLAGPSRWGRGHEHARWNPRIRAIASASACQDGLLAANTGFPSWNAGIAKGRPRRLGRRGARAL